jgi:peptidoglycan/LPS O-acetylase OafA/YrhL
MRHQRHEFGGVIPSSGSRLPGIEGLRAIAAFSIVIYHTWSYGSPSGWGAYTLGPVNKLMPDLSFGVVLFFTLSGFLLYRPFASALLRATDRPSLTTYLKNRALRILPAYWVILLLTSLALQSALSRDAHGNLTNGALFNAGVLLRSAFFIQDYDPKTNLSGIAPAWSLAVEVVFYLTLPLLVLAAVALARRWTTTAGRRMAALAPAAALLMVGLSGKAAAAFLVPGPVTRGWEADWHSVIERSFWCQADLFAFGMALAVIRTEYMDGRIRLPKWWRTGAVLLAVVGYLGTANAMSTEQLSYSPLNTVMALVCALVVALVVLVPRTTQRPPLFLRVLELPPLVAGGVISYSVFLWHYPLVRWVEAHGLTRGGSLSGFLQDLALVVAVTVVLSVATYRYVEAPALRFKGRGRARHGVVATLPPEQAEAAP